MKIEIISKKENALFKRTEIEFKILDSPVTPSRTEVKNLLLASTKAKEELLIIKKINSFFGREMSTGTAYIYSDKKDLEKIEQKYIVKRNTAKLKEAEKEESAPAEPAAEAPASEEAVEESEEESE